MASSNIFSIASTTPFLPCLAESILNGDLLPNWPRKGAFWLSDITIYVPTKRARLGLIDEFLRLNDGSQLLPNIFTLGEGDDAENAFFTDPDVDSHQVTSKTYRTAFLSRLVAAWAHKTQAGFSSPPTLVEILAMAQSLGALIDDFNTEEVSAKALDHLVPEDLAENWQQTLQFLKIAFEAWPAHLADIGHIDASKLRQERFDLASNTLHLRYGNRPVIAAGSTGSVPATARFLKAISQLPNGAIVLPGFDTSMSTNDHANLIDPASQSHAHPQYGMAHLLRTLNAQVQTIVGLGDDTQPIRRALVDKALLRPEDTANWHEYRRSLENDQLHDALQNLSVFAAPNADIEARAIAIAARQAIHHGKSVGVISPDRDLARRVRAELERFAIRIDDSAGMPLHQSPAGRWLRQILVAVQSNFAPVDLMSLLANRHVTLGLGRADVSRMRELLDISIMRGVRNSNGLQGYKSELLELKESEARQAVVLKDEEIDELVELLERLEQALAPLVAAMGGKASISRIAACIPSLVPSVYTSDEARLNQFQGAAELVAWSTELAADAEVVEHESGQDLMSALTLLMQSVTVRPSETTRQDAQIWGRIEARLLQPDMMILAGLNEGVWPEIVEPGPWLSRGMKLALSLDPPERKVGLAAHDFLMAMGAKEVLVTYAKRRGTSPADPSRFLQRFEALVGEDCSKALYDRAQNLRYFAQVLDTPTASARAERPAPKPPADIRPRRLSITEIETLIRDPYAIYAKHVLGLRKLRELGAPPDAAERGNLIHNVVAKFVEEGHDFVSGDAHATLMQLADSEYQRMADAEDKKQIWLKRFGLIAQRFLEFERARQNDVSSRHAEKRGKTKIAIAHDEVEIFGYADRIDVMRDGELEIIDFKTGGVPLPKEMQQFLSPQLPMEAIIAASGGFDDVDRAQAKNLRYIKMAHGPDAFEVKDFSKGKRPLIDVIDDYQRYFSAFAEMMLLSEQHAMVSQLTPKEAQQFPGDYDHLARMKEWMVDLGEDE